MTAETRFKNNERLRVLRLYKAGAQLAVVDSIVGGALFRTAPGNGEIGEQVEKPSPAIPNP